MARYVVSKNGVAIAAVEWDGVSNWAPPPGCTVQQDDVTQVVPVPSTEPVYIPAFLVRERLMDAGKWDATAAVIFSDPANALWFATLELGILPDDPMVIALLTSVGADPAVILAV